MDGHQMEAQLRADYQTYLDEVSADMPAEDAFTFEAWLIHSIAEAATLPDEGITFHKVEGLDILSWSPGADGEAIPCTQVHVSLAVPQIKAVLLVRLKSKAVCDSLIAALVEHRDFVFGGSS